MLANPQQKKSTTQSRWQESYVELGNIMSKFIDLIGQKFGRLTALKRVDNNEWGNACWLCLCSCKDKNKIIVLGGNLRSNQTQSCGCLHISHGHKKRGNKSKTYTSWQSMRRRCYDPTHKYYHNYGYRGITVCNRWRDSFKNFLEDMGERPKGKSLDRINNNKGYYEFNCRWVTPKINNRNKRNNLYQTHKGKTQLLVEWAEEYKIPYKILWTRIYKHDWLIKRALITPVKMRKKNEYNNSKKTQNRK